MRSGLDCAILPMPWRESLLTRKKTGRGLKGIRNALDAIGGLRAAGQKQAKLEKQCKFRLFCLQPERLVLVVQGNGKTCASFACFVCGQNSSVHEHGIAEREHAIAFLNGMMVCVHDILSGGECGNKHHQR